MSAVPYDLPGDPELAHEMAAQATSTGETWVTAIDDPHLPIHYPTVNLTHTLQRNERWISVSVAQTGETEDFLALGRVISAAVAATDRRVVVLASGGMSHRFFPLRTIRDHETTAPENVISTDAYEADQRVISHLERGDHQAVISQMDSYRRHAPEGRFGHYLAMAGALGGPACTSKATRYSDYEAAVGTGQIHLWFDL